jgi:type IV pilus assembly protein PilA
MKKQKGFSLIELLIVVGIILIIAAIAIPNLIKSRMAANESSAVGSLRALTTAEIAYATACPNLGFTNSLLQLGPAGTVCPGGANQIDNLLATGTKSGYRMAITNVVGLPANTFNVKADPVSTSSGTRHFFVDETGVIRYNPAAAASVTDNPLQ